MTDRMMLFMALALIVWTSTAETQDAVSVETLLETDKTILRQAFAYPDGRAQITAARLTVPPGGTVPLHLHPVPLFV